MLLIVVRHGQTTSNANCLVNGDRSNTKLSEEGLRQVSLRYSTRKRRTITKSTCHLIHLIL